MTIRDSVKRTITDEEGVEHLSAYAVTTCGKLLRRFGPVHDNPEWCIKHRGFFDHTWQEAKAFLLRHGFTAAA